MTEELYDTWWQEPAGEQSMEDGHQRSWQTFLDSIAEKSFTEQTILDFGCNQGGFLRFLYQNYPFKKGVGVDLAKESVRVANERKGELPLTYKVAPSLDDYADTFDFAFSSSVIYLIEDIPRHAQQIKLALKNGGVYYATFADQTKNPSLEYMKKAIDRYGAIPMQLHTIDDIVQPFIAENFIVELKRLQKNGFIPVNNYREFHLSVADRMYSEYDCSYLLRFTRQA